jgi:hypothetical protein
MPTVENRREWCDENYWQIKLNTVSSRVRMGTIARIVKTVVKHLKLLLVRLLTWLHFPFTS